MLLLRGHPLSTYAKFSEKLTFLTPWYAHVRVRIRGLEMLVFRKILRTHLMDGPLCQANLCELINFYFPCKHQKTIVLWWFQRELKLINLHKYLYIRIQVLQLRFHKEVRKNIIKYTHEQGFFQQLLLKH